MTILKFLNDNADFTVNNAVSWTGNIFTTSRVAGWRIQGGVSQNMSAEFPEAAGSEFWFHAVLGYSSSTDAWDTNCMEFRDALGNIVLQHGGFDGFARWTVTGDTADFGTYAILAEAPLVTDVQFLKNGTTDLTINVYVNGAFQYTKTVANAGDRGLPVVVDITNVDNSANFYFGECLVADEDPRGWRLVQLKPTVFGLDAVWDGAAEDITDGSLLTGISTPTLNARTSLGLDGIEFLDPAIFIDRICIQTHAQRGATGLTSFNHYFRYDTNVIQDDADILLGLSVDTFLDEYELDPNTASAWDVANMQGLQIGVRART